MDGASSNPILSIVTNQLNRQRILDATARCCWRRTIICEERDEDSLSVETALEDGQRWEDYRFWKEYAQPLLEEEDAQPVFEERLRFPESAPQINIEYSSCTCSVCLVNTRDCIIIPF